MNTATRSYSETSKATRLARALLDEGYSKEYVSKALAEKGFTPEEIEKIFFEGNQRVLDARVKANRNVLIGIAFAWLVAIATYALTDHPDGPGWLALRAFLVLIGMSIIFGIRQIILFVKSANNEVNSKNNRK